MRLTPTLLLLSCAGGISAADSWILRPEDPWSFSWEERRLANSDGVSMPGFSRTALPVQPGAWGEVGAGVRAASQGRANSVPGAAPLPQGVSGIAWAEGWLAGGPFFLHLRPEAVMGRGEIANPIAREVWTGGDAAVRLDAVEVAPRATLGITGLGHVLALSNEPFRWGDGIFGGVMMGQQWRGFPHIVLATRGPQTVAPEGSWLEPLAVGYELVGGQLVDAKPVAGEGVRFAGLRMAVRWEAVTVSWARSLLFGGSEQPETPPSMVAGALLKPRQGNDAAVAPGEPDPNRFASVGLRLDWPQHVAWSLEYGIDDQNSHVEDQSFDTTLTQAARWTSASWTATVDWLDLTGDGDWRLAAEWFRSESYVYDHGTAPWDDGGFPLAHVDGGNANSLRLLTQHVDGDDGRWTVIAGWRRQGWRNAETGNPNTARKDSGVPGSSSYARLAWDHWSLDGRYEAPIDDHWRWWCEAGAAWDVNRDFIAEQQGFSGWIGLGAVRRW
jgi:hypothetical protein